MKNLIITFTLVFLIGCEQSLFVVVEPTYKRTFSPSDRLQEGDEVKVLVDNLSPGERLEFYKCGEPCDTATNAWSCSNYDLSDSNEIIFKVREEGMYYFWFNNVTENTAVAVEKKMVKDGAYTIISESGSKVTVYPVTRLTRS